MAHGATRIFTALTIIAMCVYATWSGWSIVTFARTRTGLSGEQRASEMRLWGDRAGLGGAALEAAVSDPIALSDVAAIGQRANDLAAILSGRPLSSTAWLSLAGMRLAGGEPFAEVLSALAMSSLMGANEGSLMMQRGIFGLFQWESLPLEARSRAIGDIAGAVRWGPRRHKPSGRLPACFAPLGFHPVSLPGWACDFITAGTARNRRADRHRQVASSALE
jgi:hypothetical protein